MREKSIRYRAPEQLRQRSRREALEPPSGTTLPIRYRRMAEETARSEPGGRGRPSGSRAATDDKTARKPRPEAGRNPRTTTAGAEPRQETRRKDGNQHPNRKAAGRHRAAGRQPTTKRPASPARSGPEPAHNDGRSGAQAGNPTERRQPTSEPEGRGTPSGSRAATDDKTARKPRPKRAGTRAQRRPERSLREGTDEKTTEPSPKETAPNKFDMRYSVNAFRIPTRRRPQASTRASPDRPDSRSSAQRSSRRPPRRQAPAACAPRR